MSELSLGLAPLFLAPMRVEEVFVRRGARRAEVQRIGIGPVRATAARVRLTRALDPGRPVVLLGLGGGLRAGQRPGDIVVASELSALDSDETIALGHAGAVAERIEGFGLRHVAVAPVVSSARILHGEEAREKAAARGAVAVDMESLWCASLAREHPFAVVRVLIDVPGTELSLLAKPGAMVGACRRMLLAARALEHWSPGAPAAGSTDSGRPDTGRVAR
jgi:4-hydroxy-3-methylbut-2-enyl diphosphate reductase